MTIMTDVHGGNAWHFKMPKAEAYKRHWSCWKRASPHVTCGQRMKNYPISCPAVCQRVVIAIALSHDL